MKKQLARLAAGGTLAGILLSLVECGFLHAGYVCTYRAGEFFLAVAAGGLLFSLPIVPASIFVFYAARGFRGGASVACGRKNALLPSVLTALLFVFSLLYAHSRLPADAPFFSPAGAGVSLALIACAVPAFLLLSVVSERVIRPVKSFYWFLFAAAFLALLYKPWLMTALKFPISPPRADMPNFLLVSVDTLRADHLGCYGYAGAETGAMDGLAAGGMLFERAYTTIPHTNPAHQSLMTGLHPRSAGVVTNFYTRGDDRPVLARRMKDMGYRTAAFVSGAPLKGYHTGLAAGFDVYGDTFSFLDILDRGLAVPIAARIPFLPPPRFERGAADVTDEALAWLRKNHRRPFFLFVHYYDPHHYYIPPPEYAGKIASPDAGEDLEKLNREWVNAYCGTGTAPEGTAKKITALYDSEIAYADAQLARLLRFAGEKRLDKNTFVILLSDHGEGLTDHGDCLHGYDLYEEQTRVPLIVRGPGVPPASRSAAPVQLIDIFPTILSLLKRPVPPELQGEDLKETLLAGKEDSARTLFMETVYIERGGGKTRYAARSPAFGAVTSRCKYIRRRRAGESEFYDLTSDPRELKNLYSQNIPDMARIAREAALWDANTPVSKFKTSKISPDMAKKLRALGYIK